MIRKFNKLVNTIDKHMNSIYTLNRGKNKLINMKYKTVLTFLTF